MKFWGMATVGEGADPPSNEVTPGGEFDDPLDDPLDVTT
jgi:hypothetical protein